jgi:hypothetical protein
MTKDVGGHARARERVLMVAKTKFEVGLNFSVTQSRESAIQGNRD